jgi:hypothetical protein
VAAKTVQKRGSVCKIKKMISNGIKSSMPIGSRTSRTSKTKMSGSSNENSPMKNKVVMNIDKVKYHLQKKKKWGFKLLPSKKGKISRTIDADGDCCSSVSVLEEDPVKPTSKVFDDVKKSFDDVLDDFLVTSGIVDLMNMCSSSTTKKYEEEQQGGKMGFVFCQDIGCQGVGCQGRGHAVDKLEFEDMEGYFDADDELDNKDNLEAPLDEPVTKVR